MNKTTVKDLPTPSEQRRADMARMRAAVAKAMAEMDYAERRMAAGREVGK